MKNFYLYACSYGKYGTSIGPENWSDDGSFGKILSDRLGFNFINRSWPGGCNYHIFKNMMSDFVKNSFDETDIVLVQWTYLSRAFCIDRTKTVMPHSAEFEEYYKKYYDDLQSLSNLLTFNFYAKNKLKCNYFFTVTESLSTIKNINESVSNEFLNDPKFISIENMTPIEYLKHLNNKDLMLECMHPSYLGHAKLADIFEKLISI